jgi:hypothetical protein
LVYDITRFNSTYSEEIPLITSKTGYKKLKIMGILICRFCLLVIKTILKRRGQLLTKRVRRWHKKMESLLSKSTPRSILELSLPSKK